MSLRLAGAVVAAAALPTFASAATIRVEGATRAVIPETAVSLPPATAAPVTVSDTTDTDTVRVGARSATAQLAGSTTLFGLPLGFDVFDFGTGPSSFITRIGGNKMPPSFSPAWRLKVDHKLTDTGSDATVLSPGARVLWSFVADPDAPELELRLLRGVVPAGRSTAARVVAFDDAGAATTAAGARIRFAGKTVRADRSGRALLRTAASGAYWVSATLRGAVRSQTELLCVQPPGPPQPCSAVSFPRPGERTRRPAGIAGVAAGPGSRIEVAVAGIVGSRCRFLKRDRRSFTAPRDCRDRVALTLPLRTGGKWLLEVLPSPGGTRGLGPGRYRVSSRQVAGAQRERVATALNTVTFSVARS